MGRKPLLTLWEQEKRRLQPLLLRFTTNLTIYGQAGARYASLIDCEMGGLWGAYLIMLVLLFEVVILGAIEQKRVANPQFSGSTGAKIGILCDVAKEFVAFFLISPAVPYFLPFFLCRFAETRYFCAGKS